MKSDQKKRVSTHPFLEMVRKVGKSEHPLCKMITIKHIECVPKACFVMFVGKISSLASQIQNAKLWLYHPKL